MSASTSSLSTRSSAVSSSWSLLLFRRRPPLVFRGGKRSSLILRDAIRPLYLTLEKKNQSTKSTDIGMDSNHRDVILSLYLTRGKMKVLLSTRNATGSLSMATRKFYLTLKKKNNKVLTALISKKNCANVHWNVFIPYSERIMTMNKYPNMSKFLYLINIDQI